MLTQANSKHNLLIMNAEAAVLIKSIFPQVEISDILL